MATSQAQRISTTTADATVGRRAHVRLDGAPAAPRARPRAALRRAGRDDPRGHGKPAPAPRHPPVAIPKRALRPSRRSLPLRSVRIDQAAAGSNATWDLLAVTAGDPRSGAAAHGTGLDD